MSRRITFVLFLLGLGVLPFIALAQPADSVAFKSLDARRAVTTFEARMAKLNEGHFRSLSLLNTKFESESRKIKKSLIDGLTEAQSKATKTGNLEEAVRMRDAIKAYQDSSTNPEQATDTAIPKDAVEFSGHHYYAIAAGHPWHIARDLCRSRDGHLVRIDSEEELNFIITLMRQGPRRSYWTDLSDETTEGAWRFSNGEKAEFFNWSSGPDKHEGAQHYVYMGSNGKWDDNYSGSRISCICEWDE